MPEEGNTKDSAKKKNLLFRTIEYTRDNKCFFMVVKAFFYSASFRLQLLVLKPKKMKKHWGIEKEESGTAEPEEYTDYARKVSRAVLCVCNNTKWESKCLVRALTAGKLLRKKRLHYTMYMGVCQDETGNMIAHAWLRWGKYTVTGGNQNLDRYAIVSKFRN